jgi:hypothetical protein
LEIDRHLWDFGAGRLHGWLDIKRETFSKIRRSRCLQSLTSNIFDDVPTHI